MDELDLVCQIIVCLFQFSTDSIDRLGQTQIQECLNILVMTK